MPSHFLLDLSVLDDRFASSPLYVGIDAEQLAVVDAHPHGQFSQDRIRKYKFFQDKVPIDQIMFANKTLDLAPQGEYAGGYPAFLYEKAALYFFMDLGVNPDRRIEKQVKEQKLSMYDAWYAHGKFLKGNAKTFKEYGILIK